MSNKINELFNIKLSKKGKKLIEEWLIDEFGSLYYSKKQLDTDDAIKDFINDMLTEKNMILQDLCVINNNCLNVTRKASNKTKNFKYCPYCGECLSLK